MYRGSDYPSLVGAYVFADFISGRVFTIPADSPLGTEPEERLDTNLSISSFGEANDGELYLLDFAGGTIHQVVTTQ
ncbi:MAG: hypothetical protein U5K76_04160 [Woeseiaceae bacterium]|nr:hypothetical protein [Woeseiaceae bacterium]